MKHYQTVDPLQKESQVGRGLFGIRVLILHFKFQFSKSVKSSTFHIFLNLTYPLRKNLSFPKHLKITQKFTQNCQIVDNVISTGIWRRLKCDRDIGRKAVLSDVKTAFTFTPALSCGNIAASTSIWLRLNSPVEIDTRYLVNYSQLFPGGGGTPYNGLYGEAPPERGTFFKLQVYKRVGIPQVGVYKRVGKSII